ncbi:unnamed protein product, partial [Linum tenue]
RITQRIAHHYGVLWLLSSSSTWSQPGRPEVKEEVPPAPPPVLICLTENFVVQHWAFELRCEMQERLQEIRAQTGNLLWSLCHRDLHLSLLWALQPRPTFCCLTLQSSILQSPAHSTRDSVLAFAPRFRISHLWCFNF